MLKLCFFILFFFIFVGGAVHSQNIDSLMQVADTATGKHLSRAYGDVSSYYWRRNPFISMDYAKKAFSEAQKFPEDTTLYIESLHLMGDAFWYNNNIANSLEYALEVLNMQEKIGDSLGIGKTLNNLGVIYSNQGKIDKALEILQRSLDIKLAIGDQKTIAANYNNIGQVYYKLNEDSIAMAFFKQSVAIRKQNKEHEDLISGYNNIAAVYMREDNNSQAVKYLNRAFRLTDSLGIVSQKPVIMLNLGDVFYAENDKFKAFEWYERALDIAKQIDNYDMQYLINEQLAEVHKKEGNYQEALKYKSDALVTSDSIKSRNTNAKIEQLQFKYNARQTELENRSLKQEKELSQLKLGKERNKIQLLILLAVLALVVILLLINRYALKLRHNKHLRREVELRTRSLMREINERKRLQSSQKVIGDHFNSIFSTSPLGMVMLGQSLEIQMVNTTFADITGANKEDLIGKSINSVIQDVDFQNALQRAFSEAGGKYSGAISIAGQETKRYVNIFLNHYKSKDSQNSENTFVIIEDVSSAIEAEKRIRQSEKRFRDLSDLLPQMLVETDNEAKVVYANKNALEHFGFQQSDIEKGVFIFDLFDDKDSKLVHQRWENYRLGNEKQITKEYDLLTKNGKRLSVLASINPIIDGDVFVGFRGLLVDISERKEREEELINAKNKAEQENQMKNDFLQSLSHEIRTPMNGILGFSELIKYEEMTEEERNNYIDIIINSSNQLLSIIDDIVDLSRIETGEIVVHEREVSLQRFFNDLMIYFHGYMANRNENVTLRLNNKLPSYIDSVLLAEKQVQHIISNFVYNAIKYTDTGFIEIGVERKDNNLFFYVKDSGRGISTDEQRQIFDRLYQKGLMSNQSKKGIGLGLAIAKGLVHLLKGEIGLESKEGEGATFYFTVPYAPVQRDVKVRTAGTKMNYPNWSGKRVLVAEDDMNNYLFLEQLLKKTQAEVVHFENGSEVVDYLRAENPADLVLMDIQMPVMNGYDATREIRTFNSTIPILAQTANAMVEDKDKSIDAGCNDYLAKPINKRVLINKISALIE
ncbi:MAG: tetratricopeptide repeat protein [Salinivirgaceae bacterium]|jgi:PAS domain S-box-containing protein|nr:tetratricopeptide repeat protein [Salinivirgaceae bacterium]